MTTNHRPYDPVAHLRAVSNRAPSWADRLLGDFAAAVVGLTAAVILACLVANGTVPRTAAYAVVAVVALWLVALAADRLRKRFR